MRGGIPQQLPHYTGPAWLVQGQEEGHSQGPRLVADNRGLVGHGLGKSFKRRPVLRDVSLSVQRGEVVGLLGPNGAGKTTCFYIITGLIAADTGTVELDGQDITDLPMYRRARLGIGWVAQEREIFHSLTVEENLTVAARLGPWDVPAIYGLFPRLQERRRRTRPAGPAPAPEQPRPAELAHPRAAGR